MNDKILDIKKKASELKRMYDEDPRQSSLNVLICGEHGSGKSFLLRTARKPVLIDSFDPGGTKGLRDYIAKGEILADVRWEAEDPEKPWAFEAWKKEMKSRELLGLWPHLGTYVIDSATTWSESIMNSIQKAAGRAGEAPKFTKDYVPQKMLIRNWIRAIMKLPCDFILVGHLEPFVDQVSGVTSYRFMTTGKGVVTIPLLFDEIWVSDPIRKASGVEYRILTQSTGTHIARSRLAKGGLLSTYEEPDIKKMLKKVGLSYEDKPLLI